MSMIKEIQPLKKIKLSDEVTQALENIIVDNNMQPGDKLPSQSELSDKLKVGTRAIREAIRSLESRGLVETRQGKGVFVKNNNLDYFLETLMGSFVFHFPDHKNLLVDLTRTRIVIESQAIFEAAMNPPGGFISQFARIVEELDNKAEEKDIDSYNLLDFELHKSIIETTENKIIISLYKYLSEMLVKCFNKTGYIRGSLETSMIDHHQMLEAIVAHNAPRAKEVMEKHLGLTLQKVKNLD